MTTRLLSIVTITKFDPDGCRRTLSSTAISRADPMIEQIVVSAGGVSPQNVEEYGCRYIAQSGEGIADAFNQGLKQAEGEWLWFLNGGDCMDERLSVDFLLKLLRTSLADVILGGLTYDGSQEPHRHFPLTRQWPPLVPWIPHPAAIIRRSLFEKFGYFDSRYRIAMDYEWWLRAMSGETRVDILSVPFSRFAPGGLSQRLESRLLIAMERDDAIRRHQVQLWRTWMFQGKALIKAWVTAQCGARLNVSSKPTPAQQKAKDDT